MLRLDLSAFLRNREGRKKKVLIKIPSDIKFIRKVSSKILKSLIPYNVDADKVFDIKLCAEEAIRNAIVHGNRSDKKLVVKVTYWVEWDNMNIEIEDEGKGFDRRLIPDPTVGDNIMKGSGRGVYLIKKLMDGMKFNKAGNKIRLVKHLK